jgi:hypothetical protein
LFSVFCSTGIQGYWEPYANRKNLVLVTGARATKVTLSKQGDLTLATGVEFVHGPEGEEIDYTAGAKREVILSSGTFQSPQLLELSGKICRREIYRGSLLTCGQELVNVAFSNLLGFPFKLNWME